MRNILVLLLLFTLIYAPAGFAESDEEIVYENAYLKITPDIVSNIKGQKKYIRTSIQLMTNRADHLWEVEPHIPLIRHILLMSLVDQKGEVIATADGKEKLRQELLAAVAKAINKQVETQDLITDLFFTTYYVQ